MYVCVYVCVCSCVYVYMCVCVCLCVCTNYVKSLVCFRSVLDYLFIVSRIHGLTSHAENELPYKGNLSYEPIWSFSDSNQ